ncbi:hypothetical protein BTZ20_2382 [Rhodococcus sp. MTM3W5.2]|nr:hypothetical protein BTZ20_2382 [Rhodococcus sp. MTM3W5.2]
MELPRSVVVGRPRVHKSCAPEMVSGAMIKDIAHLTAP